MFLVAPGKIQLSVDVPGKVMKDGQVSGFPLLTWETQLEGQAPGFGLAQSQEFGQWLFSNRLKIRLSVFCLCVRVTVFQKSIFRKALQVVSYHLWICSLLETTGLFKILEKIESLSHRRLFLGIPAGADPLLRGLGA